MIVAATDSLITKREKDFSWLKAILLAIKLATLKRHGFSAQK
jgi:hypothetical protein